MMQKLFSSAIFFSLQQQFTKYFEQGKEGNDLMHELAVKTEALIPSHDYVPWIVLNGDHNEDIQGPMLQNFFSTAFGFLK